MLLAARALGLGATLTTLYLQFEKEAEAALGLPPNLHSYALLPIGYPMGRFGHYAAASILSSRSRLVPGAGLPARYLGATCRPSGKPVPVFWIIFWLSATNVSRRPFSATLTGKAEFGSSATTKEFVPMKGRRSFKFPFKAEGNGNGGRIASE